MTVPRLVTTRLALRGWRADDERDVAAAYDLYRRDEVARWLGATPRPDRGIEDARQRLERWVARTADEPEGLGLWAVTVAGADDPVGTALLLRLPDAEGMPTDEVEVGWHLHPDHWGRGYATETARALLEHGFITVGLDEIHAVAWAGNEPSFAVMKRLGMTRHGPTDRWYGVTLDWWSVVRGSLPGPGSPASLDG